MELGICETSKVLHFGGGSSQKTQFNEGVPYATSSQRRFWIESHTFRNILKNYNILNLFLVIPLFLGQNIGESLVYFFTGKFQMFAVIWKSFFWNIKNFSDTMKKRKIIQKNRTIKDGEIISKMYKGFYKLRAFMIIGMPKFK